MVPGPRDPTGGCAVVVVGFREVVVAMSCPACGAQARPDRRFCGRCGTSLAAQCPACGTAYEPDDLFCGGCGVSRTVQSFGPPTDMAGAAAVPAEPGLNAAALSGAVAERRVCSVLFCDLVGFTPLSEFRDPEEVRELLSRYFAMARTVIGRYGGVVEEVIGGAAEAGGGAAGPPAGGTQGPRPGPPAVVR